MRPLTGPALRRNLIGLTAMALAVAVLTSAPAQAGGLRELDQTIFGMDCAPCAAGLEKGIGRLHGVQSVRVSLNEGRAVVALGRDSRTTLGEIREVIRHNGFTPRDARATLVGRVTQEGSRLWLDTGRQRFLLEADGATPQVAAPAGDPEREIELRVQVPEKLANPPAVRAIARISGT